MHKTRERNKTGISKVFWQLCIVVIMTVVPAMAAHSGSVSFSVKIHKLERVNSRTCNIHAQTTNTSSGYGAVKVFPPNMYFYDGNGNRRGKMQFVVKRLSPGQTHRFTRYVSLPCSAIKRIRVSASSNRCLVGSRADMSCYQSYSVSLVTGGRSFRRSARRGNSGSAILKRGVEYVCRMFIMRNYTSRTKYKDYRIPSTAKPYSIIRRGNRLRAWHRRAPGLRVMYNGAILKKTTRRKGTLMEHYSRPGKRYESNQFIRLSNGKGVMHVYSDITRYGKFMTASRCSRR